MTKKIYYTKKAASRMRGGIFFKPKMPFPAILIPSLSQVGIIVSPLCLPLTLV